MLLISGLFKSFDPQNKAVSHKVAAKHFLEIRNELQNLLLKIKLNNVEFDKLEEEYYQLVNKYNMACKDAPETCEKAVEKAKKALLIDNDNSYSDEEIDSVLPEFLRKGK